METRVLPGFDDLRQRYRVMAPSLAGLTPSFVSLQIQRVVSSGLHLNNRDVIHRKMTAYASYILLGCIAQGLVLHLCLNHGSTVWRKFGDWLRTMKVRAAPSELVAANALRTSLPDFLAGSSEGYALKKFLLENMNPEMGAVLRLSSWEF